MSGLISALCSAPGLSRCTAPRLPCNGSSSSSSSSSSSPATVEGPCRDSTALSGHGNRVQICAAAPRPRQVESEHIVNRARSASSWERGHVERRGPGPAADLGATLSMGRLQERWEKADSVRQISEEEKSRRLAQGRWKKNLKKEGKFFCTQGQQWTLIIRLIWPHTNSSKREKYWMQLAH